LPLPRARCAGRPSTVLPQSHPRSATKFRQLRGPPSVRMCRLARHGRASDSGGVEPHRGGDDRARALCDARGRFPEPVERVLPDSGRTGDWPLHVHCFLLQLDGDVVLVDTGVGPPGAPAARWFAEPGNLAAELAATGLTPSDVTHV